MLYLIELKINFTLTLLFYFCSNKNLILKETNQLCMNTMKKLTILLIQITLLSPVFSQTIVWTGAADNAFFNEANWKNTATNTSPTAGTIDPGIAINAHLIIENASVVIGGSSGVGSDIIMGIGNLTIRKSTLKMASSKGINMGNPSNVLTIDSAVVNAEFLHNATTVLNGDSKLYLNAVDAFDSNSNININSMDAWVFASKLNAATSTTHFNRIKINGNTLSDMSNGRISQYNYGSAIAAYNSNISPLRIYDEEHLNGAFADIVVQNIHSGNGITHNFDNRMQSFKLKKGYMVTLATGNDGTGISKVYLASESDLVINNLPPALSNSISFIRVLPWIWTTKKGYCKQNPDNQFYNIINPNGGWFYDWGLSRISSMNHEYAPMGWGKTSLDSQTKRNTIINKKKITHFMSFNEADHCTAQSGQYGLLCVPDTAALWHRYAMRVGLRIVSPSCREGEELKWLKDVNDIMVPAGTRMDVIGMHWYDWGGYSSGAASDANSIFNRFKNRVIAAYNYYKMPIWITEFNANKNRGRATQDAFLQLALPWLETVPYVERYSYYQPDGGNGSFLDANGNITSTGHIYLNHVSTPSIPEAYVNAYVNNLESRMSEITSGEKAIIKNEQLQYQFNQTSKQLNVNSENIDTLNLYTLQGIKVKKIKSNTTNDLSGLQAGVYLLAHNAIQTIKIVVH